MHKTLFIDIDTAARKLKILVACQVDDNVKVQVMNTGITVLQTSYTSLRQIIVKCQAMMRTQYHGLR